MNAQSVGSASSRGEFCRTLLGFLTALLLTCASVNAQEATIIHAGCLLATPGETPLREQSIVVADGKVQSVESGYIDRPGARIIDLSSAFVLPGMIDAHVHLQFGGNNYSSDLVTLEDGVVVLRGFSEARRALEAGFTTLRDMAGDPDIVFGLREAIERGIVQGPRIVSAGPAIVPTGGGIIRGYRRDIMELLADTNLEGPCDGPASCARATRQAIKDGADLIKIVVTGSILSPHSALSQQMTDAELRAIVEAAHGMGKKVSAHAHGLPGINAALAAGVQSIEHGTYGDESSMKLYRSSGAYLVPTLTSLDMLQKRAEQNPAGDPKVRETVLAANARLTDMVRLAYEHGVKIAFGTDSNVGMLGSNAGEFRLMKAAGMSEADMIRSATVLAAELLGLQEEIGTIARGKVADIIAVEGDPLQDITRLEEVRFVMKGGTIVKQ